eukprot:405212-Amphidinium_carterae.1
MSKVLHHGFEFVGRASLGNSVEVLEVGVMPLICVRQARNSVLSPRQTITFPPKSKAMRPIKQKPKQNMMENYTV